MIRRVLKVRTQSRGAIGAYRFYARVKVAAGTSIDQVRKTAAERFYLGCSCPGDCDHQFATVLGSMRARKKHNEHIIFVRVERKS